MVNKTGALLLLVCISTALHSVTATTTSEGTTCARASWQWYKSMLSSRPLLTKATTSAAIMSISDVVCQSWEVRNHCSAGDGNINVLADCSPVNAVVVVERQSAPSEGNPNKIVRQDWERTAHVAITGFTWSGPISHAWYTILESIVRVQHRLLGIILRMLLDAVLFSPLAVAGYFTWRTLLEGKGLDGVREKLQQKWKGALVASWQFWPLVNIVNFSVVPVQFRVLYNNSLSVLWNGYLTRLNAKRLEGVVEKKIAAKPILLPTKGGRW